MTRDATEVGVRIVNAASPSISASIASTGTAPAKRTTTRAIAISTRTRSEPRFAARSFAHSHGAYTCCVPSRRVRTRPSVMACANARDHRAFVSAGSGIFKMRGHAVPSSRPVTHRPSSCTSTRRTMSACTPRSMRTDASPVAARKTALVSVRPYSRTRTVRDACMRAFCMN